MKFLTFRYEGGVGYGAVKDGGIVDLARNAALRYPTLRGVIGSGRLAHFERFVANTAPDLGLDEVEFLPPIPDPGKIFCIGLNYAEHAAEGGNPVARHPPVFVRFADSLVGHRQELVKPRESRRFDYEVELCVIIGKTARRVSAESALDYVAGYTVFNDGSIRDWQSHTAQYTAGKNFDRSGAVGPWIVTADEVPDPQALKLTTTLNGTVLQNGNTRDMIFSVREIIAYLSTFTTLHPGDMIATGTPSGVGFVRKPPVFMKPGDIVECEVEQIGQLRNGVIEG